MTAEYAGHPGIDEELERQARAEELERRWHHRALRAVRTHTIENRHSRGRCTSKCINACADREIRSAVDKTATQVALDMIDRGLIFQSEVYLRGKDASLGPVTASGNRRTVSAILDDAKADAFAAYLEAHGVSASEALRSAVDLLTEAGGMVGDRRT